MHLDDQSILEAISHNSDRGYQYLVDAYADRVFSTCLNLTRNMEDAEDATQEVFTTIYLSLDSFEGNSKLSTWIYAITANKCKEFLRKKTRKKRFGYHAELEEEDAHFVPIQIIDFQHPGVVLEDKERATILFSAIDQLAENQSIAYTLNKIEGRSYQEVAEIMDISVSSVESLLFRAKKRLQQLLEKYYRENLK
ncbi:MAG: RNA polymerase sigma factor [Fluviicola sp.]